MAIAYKSQGDGFATETTNAALAPLCPAVVAANDIMIAHVVYLDNATAPVKPSDWTLLFPNPDDISVGSGLGTGTPTGRAWAFGKIAAGAEDGASVSFGTQGGTVGRLARIYSFDGYVSGTILDVVPAASFAQNSSENDPAIQAVTTTVAGAKAVALVSQDDDNSHAGLGDVTGGTWAEAVADYVNTTVGAQGAKLQIQVGTPTSDPGTISGGTVAGTNDECNTLCFEIRPNVPVSTENFDATGDLDAQSATMSGAGLHGRTSTGALSAQSATVSGAAVVGRTGTGALLSAATAVAGAGVIGRMGAGVLVAATAALSGAGIVGRAATGTMEVGAALISGAGVINRTASGGLQAQSAVVDGGGESSATPESSPPTAGINPLSMLLVLRLLRG